MSRLRSRVSGLGNVKMGGFPKLGGIDTCLAVSSIIMGQNMLTNNKKVQLTNFQKLFLTRITGRLIILG